MSHLNLLPNRRVTPSASISFVLGLAIAGLAAGFLWSGTREATAQAVPSRIGVVDFQRLLRDSVPGKASVAKMTTMQNDRLAKAKQMTEEIQRLENDLKNPALAAQRNVLTQRLTEKQVAMKRFAEDADKELGTLRDRELTNLQTRIRPIIDAIGKEMAMAAIFNKYESGIVYANDAIDVTNQVIVRFNSAPMPAVTPRN